MLMKTTTSGDCDDARMLSDGTATGNYAYDSDVGCWILFVSTMTIYYSNWIGDTNDPVTDGCRCCIYVFAAVTWNETVDDWIYFCYAMTMEIVIEAFFIVYLSFGHRLVLIQSEI